MKHSVRFYLVILMLAVVVNSCQKPERDNIWDELARLNPEEWMPQDFKSEAISIYEQKLSWTYGDKEIEGFRLDRRRGNEEWQSEYQVFDSETRSWNDSSLIPDPTLDYQYRLYAYAAKNTSAPKSITVAALFPAPDSLQMEKRYDIGYRLYWRDNSIGEEGFKIDRKRADSDWEIAYGIVDQNTTTFVDTNVFAGKTGLNVEYRVYAYYKEKVSGNISTSAQAILTPPQGLWIHRGSNLTTVVIRWSDDTSGEQGWLIERKYDDGDWAVIDTADVEIFFNGGIELNRMIYYRVYAYNGDYRSDYAEGSYDASLPGPTNFQITRNSISSVSLHWQDNYGGELGTIIERKYETGDWVEIGTINGSSWQDNDFELNTHVFYRLYTVSGNYISAYAENSFDATILPLTNFQINQNTLTEVTLSWQDNNSEGASYEIERRYETTDWEDVATITGTSWQDNDFELNTLVHYRIRAVYNQYYTDWTEHSFYTSMPAPENLQLLTNSVSSITVNWDYSITGNDGFLLERKVNDDPWSVVEEAIAPDMLSYTDELVNLNDNLYSYRLSAFVQNTFSNTIETGMTVFNPATGRTWMDRNLGATRVAQSSDDDLAYGDLYQWGRLTDGHEKRSSATTTTLSSNDNPGHDAFILVSSAPYDWRSPQNNNLWQGLSGINNPCPAGYRLPTEAEWDAERQSWSSNNLTGAIDSPLRLAAAGIRNYGTGEILHTGSVGYYWSGTADGTAAPYLDFSSDNSSLFSDRRAYGSSVRCIKD